MIIFYDKKDKLKKYNILW